MGLQTLSISLLKINNFYLKSSNFFLLTLSVMVTILNIKIRNFESLYVENDCCGMEAFDTVVKIVKKYLADPEICESGCKTLDRLFYRS